MTDSLQESEALSASAKSRSNGGDAPQSGVGAQIPRGARLPGEQDILDRARDQGADENALAVLEGLPDRYYDRPVAVSRELGQLD